MRIENKIKLIGTAAAAVLVALIVLWFKMPTGENKVQSVSIDEISEYRPSSGFELTTRAGFISELVRMSDELDGVTTSSRDYLERACTLGIISSDDTAFYNPDEGVCAQEAAALCRRAVCAADSGFTITDDEANHILNTEYNNAVLDDDRRTDYAFAVKHGIIDPNLDENPLVSLPEEYTDKILYNTENIFFRNTALSLNNKKIRVGESVKTLIGKCGNPDRIDKTEYGFEWYVYNEDYSRFMMIGVEDGRVCALFSNAAGASVGGLSIGADYSAVKSFASDTLMLIEDEQSGLLDAVYFNLRGTSSRTDYSAADKNEIQYALGAEVLDFINAARTKKKQAVFLENPELVSAAYENSRQYAQSGIELGTPGTHVILSADNIFKAYENMLSLRFAQIWEFSPKTVSYGGGGVYDGVFTFAMSVPESRLTIPSAHKVEPVYTQYAPIKSGTPALLNSLDGAVIAEGEPMRLELSAEGADSLLVEVLNCETRDYTVNARITGDLTEYVIPAERFESGADYELNVTAYYGGAEVMNSFALLSYGEPSPIEILSPTPEHDLTDAQSDINVIWKSDVYTDFQIELATDSNQPVASSRVIDAKETALEGLSAGKYILTVSAMRRDTNVIKSTAQTTFEITPKPVTEIIRPTAAPKASAAFKSNRYASVFGSSNAVYTSKAEADSHMQTVTVPVWHLDASGNKVPATARITVNAAVADDVIAIFTEIYSSPEKFPIKSAGGYNWRSTATGSRSQHSYGTCIDINSDENYCIYRSGKKIGSFWKPGESPYSMPANGSVVTIFKNHGWTWGGEWNSLQDYMHFSFLGG